jgi:hypothetical protein
MFLSAVHSLGDISGIKRVSRLSAPVLDLYTEVSLGLSMIGRGFSTISTFERMV